MKSDDKFTISVIAALPIIHLFSILPILNPLTEASSRIENDYAGLDYSDFDQRIFQRFFDDEYEENHHSGRVFYSHSMMVYGTEDEDNEKELIRTMFKDFGIVSPKFYEGKEENMRGDMDRAYKADNGEGIQEMEFYKMIVSTCDMLVYSKWKGQIASGVAIEVNHAIDIGIPVFELVGHEFISQKLHVDGLSYQEISNINKD